MPLPEPFGSAQGDGPNSTATSNTFLPELRGEMVPLKLHPADDPMNVPLVLMTSVALAPWRVVTFQLPAIALMLAGVL